MRITDEVINKIIEAVKKEPLTIQDISKIIKRSWVTTEKYVKFVVDKTGTINIKAFRKGTYSAIKVVYYERGVESGIDEVKKILFNAIINGRYEQDFDFMEVFQFIEENKKNSTFEKYSKKNVLEDERVIKVLGKANSKIFVFSGNLSYIGVSYSGKTVINIFEEALKKGVFIKILTRVDMTSLRYISKLQPLLSKYKNLEIRHAFQSLRGFIVDNNIGRFKNDEHLSELYDTEEENARLFYEVYDEELVMKKTKIFENLTMEKVWGFIFFLNKQISTYKKNIQTYSNPEIEMITDTQQTIGIL